MKKTFKFLLLASIIAIFYSCEKDPENIKFSELSVEENKEVVEDATVKAAQAMRDMTDLDAVEVAISMINHLDMADPFESKNTMKSAIMETMTAVAGIDGGKDDYQDLFSAMKSPLSIMSDPETLDELWDEVVGTYAWNPSTESWDYTANPDAFVLEFPSTENGTTNNAVLTVDNFSSVDITTPIEDEYNGELPATLDVDLSVDGSTVMSYYFEISYNEDGLPTSVETELTLTPFAFMVKLENNDTKASASQSIKKDGEVILEISGEITGDFTQENIDANTHTYSDEWDTWEEVDVEEVITNGEFTFQLYNISIKGIGDFKALGDSLDLIYPDGYYDDPAYDEKEAREKEAAAINNAIGIYVIDTDANKKIAEGEAYVVTDSYGNGYYDYWVDFRLVFGDGSYVDLETYFEDGFERLVGEINAMIDELNEQYDAGLDRIDY
jgi:hypothetical protein